jgi:hypothetical protein
MVSSYRCTALALALSPKVSWLMLRRPCQQRLHQEPSSCPLHEQFPGPHTLGWVMLPQQEALQQLMEPPAQQLLLQEAAPYAGCRGCCWVAAAQVYLVRCPSRWLHLLLPLAAPAQPRALLPQRPQHGWCHAHLWYACFGACLLLLLLLREAVVAALGLAGTVCCLAVVEGG